MAGYSNAVLVLKILGDPTSAIVALDQVEAELKDVDKTTTAVGKTTKKTTTAAVGLWSGVAAALLACSRSAAALEQSTNAVATIYDDMAPDVMAWAEGMAQYGLSTAQAAQAAAVLGAQLQNAGIPMEATAVLSTELIELSIELANVMGGTAVEAIQAMGAAFRGEYDSLERFGITLTADAVATEILRLESEGLTFATEQQAKAVATLSLIQAQSTLILGEAEEQTVTMNQATQHLRASISNLADEIGGPLNAVLGPLIETVADIIDKFTGWIQESELLNAVLGLLGDVLQKIADILNATLIPILERAIEIFNEFKALLEKYVVPILDRLREVLDKVATALDKVIGLVEDAIGWFQDFTSAVHEAIDALTFWNDTYDASTEGATAPTAPAPEMARRGVGAHGLAAAGYAAPTINVYMGVVGDPHAAAREIRRVLATDDVEQGRLAGIAPRRAW